MTQEKKCDACRAVGTQRKIDIYSRLTFPILAIPLAFACLLGSSQSSFLFGALVLAICALVVFSRRGRELWYSLEWNGHHTYHVHAFEATNPLVMFRANPLGFIGKRDVYGDGQWWIRYHLPTGQFQLVGELCDGTQERVVGSPEALLRFIAIGAPLATPLDYAEQGRKIGVVRKIVEGARDKRKGSRLPEAIVAIAKELGVDLEAPKPPMGGQQLVPGKTYVLAGKKLRERVK